MVYISTCLVTMQKNPFLIKYFASNVPKLQIILYFKALPYFAIKKNEKNTLFL